MAGLECERRMWLQVHHPRDARPLALAERHRLETGIRFGRDATRLFPGGVLIAQGHDDLPGALAETQRQLRAGAPALFEAAFQHDGVLIRADVLERLPHDRDGWHLVEVKSQTNGGGREPAGGPNLRKLRKLAPDMAVQLHVLEGAGLRVSRISLGWVNSRYERQGELDWRELVAIDDCTELVRRRRLDVPAELAHAMQVLELPELPPADYGKNKCEGCAFDLRCWGHEPKDSIIYLPRAKPEQLESLRRQGITRIPQIPKHFALEPAQAAVRAAYEHPDGFVSQPRRLEQWLDALDYPLHYLDFESWNPCVPPFDRVRPYAQIPFQYSLHVQAEPGGETTHREYLAEAEGDPRAALAERLLADIGPSGSLVAHHARFEKERIAELAELLPGHHDALRGLLGRFVDTETPFKQHWIVHPGLLGRSSLKVVLPVMTPGLGYDDLAIADGETATIRFGELYEKKITGARAEAVRRDLLEYCRRDTFAMVQLVDGLRARAGATCSND